MLLRRLQCLPNIKSALAQRLLETHLFQGPNISFAPVISLLVHYYIDLHHMHETCI